MKTWEMIKELTENPNKRFISRKGTEYEMVAEIKSECLFIESKHGITSVDLKREWEEVKHPMTFMDAVQTGRYIKSVDSIITKASSGYDFYEDYQPLNDFLYRLGNDFSSKEIRCILYDSKFYVEEVK